VLQVAVTFCARQGRRVSGVFNFVQRFAASCNTGSNTCGNDFENLYCYIYSWHFSRYSVPIHRLVHGHMTSNNETVYHQMPWAGQHYENYDVKRETVHCYPQNVDRCQVIRACSSRWPDVVAGISLNDWSLGERWNFVSLESQCFPRLRLQKHWNSGKQNSLFSLGPVISVKCNTVAGATRWRETMLQLILVACPWETSRDTTCIFQLMGCQRRFGDMPREIIFLGARKCCFPCFPINSFRGKNAEH